MDDKKELVKAKLEDPNKALVYELEHEIKMLEQEILPTCVEQKEEQHRRIDLMNGVIIGLVFGVVGNFFVQYFYALYEKLVSGNSSEIWITGLFCGIFGLVLIVATLSFRSRLEFSTNKMYGSRDWEIVTRRMIEEKKEQLNAIKNRT